MTIWKKKDAFGILNVVIEDLTLVQLMDSLGNVNHIITILRHWIFDSNYEKVIFLTQELLDIILSPCIGEVLVAMFQSIFYAFRYSWAQIHLKEG